MEFFRRVPGPPARLGVFPGTFNPVTVAHLALAKAALDSVAEVLFVLPREFPHKRYSGASFEERVEMLCASLADAPAFSLAAPAGGLFAEIAVECRQAYGEGVHLSFLCGRDAAERVADWDYGQPDAFAGMLRDFEILVASRGGDYHPAPHLRARVRRLEIAAEFQGVSATEVRRRIALGEPWEHMAPAAVRETVRRIYRFL
jgi:nicotinate-nucleotide adenylyltransferase